MNERHLMGVLHSFSIKNIFHDKLDLRLLFSFDDLFGLIFLSICNSDFQTM